MWRIFYSGVVTAVTGWVGGWVGGGVTGPKVTDKAWTYTNAISKPNLNIQGDVQSEIIRGTITINFTADVRFFDNYFVCLDIILSFSRALLCFRASGANCLRRIFLARSGPTNKIRKHMQHKQWFACLDIILGFSRSILCFRASGAQILCRIFPGR